MKRIYIALHLLLLVVVVIFPQTKGESNAEVQKFVGLWTEVVDNDGTRYKTNSSGYDAAKTSTDATQHTSTRFALGTYKNKEFAPLTFPYTSGTWVIKGDQIIFTDDTLSSTTVWRFKFENNDQNVVFLFLSESGGGYVQNVTKCYYSKKQ
jgi:hypothetical protein